MAKTNQTGWRGFSSAKETAQGTAQTVDFTLKFEGEPLDREPDATYKNDNEITGHRTATEHEIIRYKLDGGHKQKLMPQNAALFLAQAMGDITSSQPDGTGAPNTWEHVITYLNAQTGIVLPTRTMYERDGISDKTYPGVACKSVKISAKRGDFCELEAELVGLGLETIAAIDTLTRPTRILESYLRYGQVTIRKGGTWSNVTKTITGGTDIVAKVKNFNFSFDNGAKPEFFFGETSDAASEIRSGRVLDVSLDADIEIDDETHKTDLEAGTEFSLVIPITGTLCEGTYYYTVELLFPRVKYDMAKKASADGLMQVGSKLVLLADPDNAVYVRVINKKETFL